ncbi:hypothetical protein R3P38DRAFT_213802 [Favolaschia claudopus]|uniref:Secreted protein n=1 Tax=Favolaschia claudopus TaxID=2862362 RepID=A0AAV9ZUV9_9AGAR
MRRCRLVQVLVISENAANFWVALFALALISLTVIDQARVADAGASFNLQSLILSLQRIVWRFGIRRQCINDRSDVKARHRTAGANSVACIVRWRISLRLPLQLRIFSFHRFREVGYENRCCSFRLRALRDPSRTTSCARPREFSC